GGNRWPIPLFSRSELHDRWGDRGPPAISQMPRHPTQVELASPRFHRASDLLHVVFRHALRIDHILAIGGTNLHLPRLHAGVITLKRYRLDDFARRPPLIQRIQPRKRQCNGPDHNAHTQDHRSDHLGPTCETRKVSTLAIRFDHARQSSYSSTTRYS